MNENKGKSAGRTVATVLLSILLCLTLLVSALLTAARNTISSGNIAKLISTLDLGGITVPGSAGGGASVKSQAAVTTGTVHASSMTRLPGKQGGAVLAASESGDKSLAELIAEGLKNQEGLEGMEDITSEQIEHVLEQDFAQDFLSGVTSEYVDAILNDQELPEGAGLDADRVTDFLMEHEDDINNALAETGFKGKVKIDPVAVRDGLDGKLEDVIPVEEIREQYAQPLNVVRNVISTKVILAAWGVCAVLAAVILLVNRKKLSGGLLGVGVPALIVGALLLAPALLAGMLTGSNVIAQLVGELLKGPLVLVGAISGASGLVLIVAGAILGAVGKKKVSA